MNPEVDVFFTDGCGRCPLGGTPECKVHNWDKELAFLRTLVLDCGLDEELKWGVPVYSYNGKNVVVIGAFIDNCVLSFFKGVLLSDELGILTKPGEHTQSARVVRFTNLEDIVKLESDLKTYIYEAIEVERAGLKVEFKKNPEPIPAELQDKIDSDPVFKEAFDALTPGRQRGYILHFSQPKQSKTRISRIEKSIEKIFEGKGYNER
ncbi:YdeI/OmpD-associated family protein [Portibacter lacus]|uniref:YdhG-like domain-containing protein n=1 Tax=Portibacter lacus TaxID=1099794 RepID=A0AA37SNW0_9BACT|nr:YdeI/OmpD-associated family protein [Portibacter lacus]GLR17297.1 hypothetical protein GCM10007940_19120 [Portibacter lacus]